VSGHAEQVGNAERRAWEEPGAELVAPGVHRIPLPLPNDGLRAVNVYALEERDGLTLVDGGWAFEESLDRLDAALRSLDAGLDDVRRILVTHVHRDHYTQAVAIRRRVGCEVLLGSEEVGTLEVISGLDATIPTSQLDRLRRHGAGELADVIASRRPMVVTDRSYFEDPDGWIAPDAEFAVGARRLRAIATPGHTRGHLVFRSSSEDRDEALLFAGDHILPHITPSIGFEANRPPTPLRDYLASLRTMLELPDSVLLPAHGPVAPSVHQRVHELLAHHDERLELTQRAVAAGAASARDVAVRLTWTRRGTAFADLDPFNAMLAVLETAAHLDVLMLRGDVERSGDPEAGAERVHYVLTGSGR
jgi:glyoxylase-like metal-dependent hydrolase (beta-lactamase superfamily II)